ncbi:MAG: TetR/AcrR family transcriptional regulator [Lachnospiraceae bacterium]|nr:TetR/AcrR family transcriptional regulator [Lachnospiraceae bacterium]
MSTASVREKIINAALDLFSQKGYDATSVDEIAESIGMKGPNIYKYFKGKEEVLKELSAKMEEGYRQRMKMNPEEGSNISNRDELKEYSMNQIRFTIEDDKIKKLRKMGTIEQFRNPHFSRQTSEHQFDNMQRQFTAIFKSLMDKGVLDNDDPEMMAMEYYAPVSLLIQLCDREPDRKEEVMGKVEKYIDFFLNRYFKKAQTA